MSRKHYEALAAEIASMDLSDAQRREVASGVARVCKMERGAFNRERFLTACGVQ